MQFIACPFCSGDLELFSIEAKEVSVSSENFVDVWHDAGLLLCRGCKYRYPIYEGLPVLLPYTTALHSAFEFGRASAISRFAGYSWPSAPPAPGEQFVMKSFSREWLEYDYDGVMWDLSYADHKARLYAELGVATLGKGSTFLEIGSGLGMSTCFAQEALQGEAIGVDLSLAALSATRHFMKNPFLHFIQASVFMLPVREGAVDVVYSHGVLHHTYSTRKAFLSMASRCRPGGTAYVWLYGSDSLKGSPARRIAWKLEKFARPLIARRLDSLAARTALAALAIPYVLGNAWHRRKDPAVQQYNFQRALSRHGFRLLALSMSSKWTGARCLPPIRTITGATLACGDGAWGIRKAIHCQWLFIYSRLTLYHNFTVTRGQSHGH
jgi:SAM-dependent methyltransferase/uncharacterized protein YbaR (Trm112 family)